MAHDTDTDHDAPCCHECGTPMVRSDESPEGCDWYVFACDCGAAYDDEGGYYDESMDGDHGSALASAGLGTDEDYGGECYDYEGGYYDD